MKANYKTANGRLTFEVTGETPKDLFRQVAQIQEVFDAEFGCGCCQSKDIRFQHRQVDDYEFYELSCAACRARFAFGQAKKGGALFPKRSDEDRHPLPNGGWSKFVPKSEAPAGSNEPAQSPIRSAPGMSNSVTRESGVAVFADWEKAESSNAWGEPWMKVAGVMFKLVNGNYTAQAAKVGK